MTAVSVIVPARDAEATLPRTLAALAQQRDPPEYEVLVVDDGSTDQTAAAARKASQSVKLIRQGRLGPAAARNSGVAASRGRALAFCDADCFPTPGWLRAGAQALESADLVQGRVVPDPGVPVGPFDRTLWIPHEVGLYETANLFTTRRIFDRTGGFEDWLEPVIGKAMAEDVWFGWRAKRLGARSSFCADALAYHAVFPRRPREYVTERRRLRHFPAMAHKIPELRTRFLWGHVFLNRRTAAFDLALAGLGVSALMRNPLSALAGAPYAWLLLRRSRQFGLGWPRVAAADLAADLVGLGALLRGSLESRSPVL